MADLRGYSETVMTPEIRLTMPFLTEKNVYQGKEQSWSITGLVSKEDQEALKFFESLLTEYYEVDDLSQVPSHPFVNGKSGALNDGDDPAFEEYNGYKGHVFFKATSNFESLFECIATDCEMDGSPCERRIATPDEIHAGCFGQLVINCKEYDPGKVKFYLQGLVKTRRGDVWALGKGAAKSLLGLSSARLTPVSNGAAKEAAQAALNTPVAAKKSALSVATVAPAAEAPKRGRPAAKTAGSLSGGFNPPPLRAETVAKQEAAEEADTDVNDDTPEPPAVATQAPTVAKKKPSGLSALLQRPAV